MKRASHTFFPRLLAAALLFAAAGCVSVGSVEASACRYFVLAIIPFGDSTFSTAVENALKESDADVLLNVSTSSSLYGFVPLYNLFSFTCTSVQGTAVKIDAP